MVEKLKEITQTKIGFEISTLSDCKRLSAIILTVTDSYISYNTLRRLFGIIKMVKPSEFTLDAISKFNDFKNYNDFLINYNLRNKYYEEFKIINLLQYDEDESVICLIKENLHKKDEFYLRLTKIITELLVVENFKLLNKIFNMSQMKFTMFSFDEVVLIGMSAGKLLKRLDINNSLVKELILNTNFQDLIITINVSYDGSKSNYNKIIKHVYDTTERTDLKEFCKGVLNVSLYLEKQPISRYYKLKINHEFHPILKSRIISQNLLENNENIINILNIYFEKFHENRGLKIEYFFEIVFTSIITSNFEVMEWIISKVNNYTNYKYFYKFEHFQNFTFMKLIYLLKVKDHESIEIVLKNFSFDRMFFSYSKLLYKYELIFKYHFYSADKKTYLNKYTESNKSVYPDFFTTSYLKNYFS